MNFKTNNPFLGFYPSEIRFFNGNGNGNGDLNGGDFGADIGGVAGEASQAGGAVSTGGVIGGTPGESPSASPDLSLNDAMNILGGAYPSSPAPSAPSAPSTMDDLSKAFSSPPIEFEESEPEISRSKGLTLGKFADTAAQLGIPASRFGPYGLIGAVFGLFGAACITVTKAFELNEGKGYTPGQLIDMGLIALGLTQAQAPAQPQAQPSPAPASVRGTPVTLSPEGFSGKKSEGNLEAILSLPSQREPSYPSTSYVKTGYPSLSTSLFGLQVGKESSGGLMIFPTSAKGIEAEGSSLLKKQEPVIDTTSILFLLGMGIVGLVLRKAARA